jgi:hypothetical protein
MSALTDLKARITGPDGGLRDRLTIERELNAAIEQELSRLAEYEFRLSKQRECIKALRAQLDAESKLAGTSLFKCGIYEIMVRRLREWDSVYLSDGMARRDFKAILKEAEETRP